MKGAIAAMLHAAADVRSDTDLRGTLVLAFTADEENGSLQGMEWLCHNGMIDADAAVMAEPASFGPDSWRACTSPSVARASPASSRTACPATRESHWSPLGARVPSSLGLWPRSSMHTCSPTYRTRSMAHGRPSMSRRWSAEERSRSTSRNAAGDRRRPDYRGDDRGAGDPRAARVDEARGPRGTSHGRARAGDELGPPRQSGQRWPTPGATRAAWRDVLGREPRERVFPAGTDSSHVDALGSPRSPRSARERWRSPTAPTSRCGCGSDHGHRPGQGPVPKLPSRHALHRLSRNRVACSEALSAERPPACRASRTHEPPS